MRDDGILEIRGEATRLCGIMEQIYVDMIESQPDYLPMLFPVFAVICGDREKNRILTEKVDWSLVE